MAKCIYVAGALNANDAITYIKNMNRMFEHSLLLMEAGYSVFVPGLDILLLLKSDKPSYNKAFFNSWWWIKKADGIYVVPKSKKSKGTKREIKLAEGQSIPIFYSIEEMDEYFFNEKTKVKKIKRKVKI